MTAKSAATPAIGAMNSRGVKFNVSFRVVGWLCLVALGLPFTRFNASAYTAADAQAMVTSFNDAFYFTNGTRGYFRNSTAGGTTWFWGRANQMEMLIDLYEQTTNAAYLNQFSNLYNGFTYDYGTSWTWNEYNDDIMWMVIACSRAYQKTGFNTYRSVAKSNFDACCARAWDTTVGGGLYWKYPVNSSKNACVNGPGAIAAYLIYQNYGDTNYLAKAESIYLWERAKLFNAGTGLIADYISTNGVVYGGATTYNQGTFIGAANFLGYTNDALLAANYTKNSMGTGGQLPNYEENSDLGNFNAIFIRWMVKFMKERGLQGSYQLWLQQNANAAWNMRRQSDNISWSKWWDQTPDDTRYSVGCWGAVMAMNLVPPTQTPGGSVVTLNTSDVAGSSSFESALNWSDAAAPSSARNYLVHSARTLRTPADGSHHTFAGSSLTLSNGAVLAFKNTSGSRYVSVGTDLFLDGGEVHNWAGNSASLGGKVTLRAGGGKIDPQGNTFSFPALIGGPGMLRIGATASSPLNGTVNLNGVNTYTGGTVIEAPHTVQMDNPAGLGSTTGSLSFSNSVGRGYGTLNLNGIELTIGKLSGAGGTILNNASGTTNTLTIGNGDATGSSFQGTIADGSGVVEVSKTGAGTLTLAGNNSYSGDTAISGGIVNAQNNNAFGTIGTVSMLTRSGGIQLQGGINIPSGVTFKLSNDGIGAVPYALGNVSGNNKISGLINIGTGGGSTVVQSDGGSLTLAGSISVASGSSSRGVILQGASTGTNTVSGVLSNNGSSLLSIQKVGAGTWALTAENTYSGGTTVSNGTLLVNNTSGSGTGSGGVLVSGSGAVLAGKGIIAGTLDVQAGGTVAPGIPPVGAMMPAIGMLTAGNTTINGSVRLKIDRGAVPSSDKLVASTVTVISGATLTVTNLGSTNLVAGDVFTLFGTPISGAFSVINLPPLPDAGLAWANNLAVDGSIAVVTAVSTAPTNLAAQFSSDALTLSWPADHLGWRLQTQTNPLAAGLAANWFDVSGAASTNQITFPIAPGAGAVFFRLIFP